MTNADIYRSNVHLMSRKTAVICRVNAPGLVSPSFWLVAQGSISVAKLDIALFDRDKDHAVRTATRMVQSLHPAGYYMFSLYDATGAHLLAEFVTNQPALEIVVKRCD